MEAVIKYPERSNFREEGFISSQFKVMIHLSGESQRHKWEAAAPAALGSKQG